jgi:hypothetical protein
MLISSTSRRDVTDSNTGRADQALTTSVGQFATAHFARPANGRGALPVSARGRDQRSFEIARNRSLSYKIA